MARKKFLCDADRCIECNACVTACKNEHEVPGGINRRRVVTTNDGNPGERFDLQAGDVGYVPFAMGHYIENTGSTSLRFLEMFRSNYFADVSLDTWMALTPPELVEAHLNLGPQVMAALRKKEAPIVPA
jgi:oxalate decarboxylase/phosphoglucose isomerase-like protein (cupin superfamily)